METIETLGKYEIKGTLGRGAMGTVYEGWDPIIARRVAIKTVKIPDAEDLETEDQLARFRREAQAAGRLIHPNIVGVFDYGETNDLAYIVMEFVDGPSVKSLLDKQERFALPDAMRIMQDLLAGLQFSHERGVVHRDIKPANVMLTSEGQAKIADFGIARIESSSMTQAGTVLGTPAYMSPEQFMGQVVDKRSDIYSTGVLLHQLLTGERPFEGGLSAIMHKALNTEPPAPSQISVTCPPAFDPVVRRAMAKRPEDRFQSADAFARALRAAAAGEPGEGSPGADEATMLAAPVARTRAAPPAAGAAAPAASAARKSSLPLVLVSAAVLLLAIGGGGWFWLTSPARRPAQTAGTQPAATPVAAVAGSTAAATPRRQSTAAQATGSGIAQAAATPAATPAGKAGAAPGTAALQQAAATPMPQANAGGQPASPPACSHTTDDARRAANRRGGGAFPAAPITPVQPPPPGAGQQVATIGLGALRRRVSEIVAAQPCSTLSGVVQDSGTVALAGLAGTNAADAVREALAGQLLDWRVTSVDPYYCPALNVVHPIAVNGGAPGRQLQLSLAGGKTRLHDGQRILPQLVMPDFRGYLRVDYVAHDGGVMHLYPQVADPANKLAGDATHSFPPNAVVKLGEPAAGHPAWEVSSPMGTDMIIAVASSQPLFTVSRPGNVEQAASYLRQLQDAVDAARRRGDHLAGIAITLDTLPK